MSLLSVLINVMQPFKIKALVCKKKKKKKNLDIFYISLLNKKAFNLSHCALHYTNIKCIDLYKW